MMVLFFSLSSLIAQAQNKSTLNSQVKQLEKEIAYTTKLIKETRKDKTVSVTQLNLLNQQIRKQEKLIIKMRQEIQLVEKSINEKQLNINKKEQELESLKKEYALLIINSQKNLNTYNRMMFIFASKDFNQAFKRLKYFEQYSQYRKKQVEIIEQKQDSLHASLEKLNALKKEKEVLRVKEEKEKRSISQEKIKQQRDLNKLKGKEAKLKRALKKQNRQKDKLKKKIEAILIAEVKKNKEFSMTPDQVQLSKGFEKNKGKLPWPVEKGVVFSSFGEHAHPVLRGIKIRNDGIDIVTNKGSNARVIFNGEVRSIISVPGSANFAVLVKHGDFFSLYSNLVEVFVKPGDQLKVKQDIGKISLDKEDNTTKLQFQIWKSTSKLNPVRWLAR
ncbi:MAG: peptidoglycan DD-metalloendopeptidase family protein [Bacteroidales bacterium]|nr:peptidoglycan DD-metalloendopeptidase family protein [Bacteroidales bacterium]